MYRRVIQDTVAKTPDDLQRSSRIARRVREHTEAGVICGEHIDYLPLCLDDRVIRRELKSCRGLQAPATPALHGPWHRVVDLISALAFATVGTTVDQKVLVLYAGERPTQSPDQLPAPTRFSQAPQTVPRP